MSHFWTVWIFKTESKPVVGFPHTPRVKVQRVEMGEVRGWEIWEEDRRK